MNESSTNSPAETPANPLPDTTQPDSLKVAGVKLAKKSQLAEGAKLDPVAVLFAMASQARWAIMRYLADGRAASVMEIARVVGMDRDAMAKQLRAMRDAGVLESPDGEDRRFTLYQIPASRRRAPGVIDYGFCVVDLNKV